MLYICSHTTNKLNFSFPHHILYLHCHFFPNFVSIQSIKLVIRISIYGIVSPGDNDMLFTHIFARDTALPISLHSLCWKMLKEHEETENFKSTLKIRKKTHEKQEKQHLFWKTKK